MKLARLKLLSLTLIAAAMLSVCSGCRSSSDNHTVTTVTTAPETDVTITETLPETTPETEADPLADCLLLVKDGASDYRIVIPDYAAAWEREAADSLQHVLGVDKTPLPVMSDAETPAESAGKTEIVVGYTDRTSALPADFFSVGRNGYSLAVIGQKLYIGANSETGMKSALEQLGTRLVRQDQTVGLFRSYTCTAEDKTEPPVLPELSGTYAQTIRYASTLQNGTQAGYVTGRREAFGVTNSQMQLTAGLSVSEGGQIRSLVNDAGIPYLRDTLIPYMITADGAVHTTMDSSVSGHMNIFRYGVYYYENHILGHNFGSPYRLAEDGAEAVDLLKRIPASRAVSHDIEDLKKNKDGSLSYRVTDANDPYFYISTNLNLDTNQYNGLLVTLRTTDAAKLEFFLAAGDHANLDGTQSVSIGIDPNGQYNTYLIPLSKANGYKGQLRVLRMDCGGAAGETVEIKEIKAVSLTQANQMPSFVMDRTLHTFTDRQNEVFHFVATEAGESLDSYGMTAEIDRDRVNALIVLDKNGEHDSLDDVDWPSAVAVGFDIDRAGVFGLLLTADEDGSRLTVTERDGRYIIDQRVKAASDRYTADTEFFMTHRLYTDPTHSFEGLSRASFEEQHPLSNVLMIGSVDHAKYTGYNPRTGVYEFFLDSTDFSTAYYKQPDKHYRFDTRITSPDDRQIYVMAHSTGGGCLENSVILDSRDRLLPLPVQVCKNFDVEFEEPLYNKGDQSYGDCYFPVSLKANEPFMAAVLHLYQNWGTFPLKQLSSIQFIAPYYHLSTGVTETNCIAPYYVSGKDLWTLPDFRAMSAPMWAVQPQHDSAGRLYFLEYTDADGRRSASEDTVDHVDSCGPTYADVDMSYISDDGRIQVDYRHLEMPQTDENRTYYEVDLKVLEDIHFKDFMQDFQIFAMDGRRVVYDELGYLDEHDQPVATKSERGKDAKPIRLGKASPYFAYAQGDAERYVNMAMVIKDWSITVGGEAYTDHLILLDRRVKGTNRATLTLDLHEVTLKAGDTWHFSLILLPWGSQKTPAGDFSNVQQVRKDTCLDPFRAEVRTGTAIPDTYLPKIRTVDGTAEFTVRGGENNMVVRVYGLSDHQRPTIEEYVDGAWVPYETASKNGYDGYMVYYDGDGTYSCSFVIPMKDGAPRTFRVTG